MSVRMTRKWCRLLICGFDVLFSEKAVRCLHLELVALLLRTYSVAVLADAAGDDGVVSFAVGLSIACLQASFVLRFAASTLRLHTSVSARL